MLLKVKRILVPALVYGKDFFNKNYLPKRKKVIYDIPYFSQWESPDLVEKIIQGKTLAKDDPKWSKSGAHSKAEYALWSWNACGIACLKMVLASKKIHIPLVKLCKLSLKYDCFKANEPINSIIKKIQEGKLNKPQWQTLDGLFYEPFTVFIKKEFNLSGKMAKFLSLGEVIQALDNKNLVMVSVSGGLKYPDKQKDDHIGGHIVLIVGYDYKKRILYLHNPAGLYKISQKFYQIDFKRFNNFFANKGVVIST